MPASSTPSIIQGISANPLPGDSVSSLSKQFASAVTIGNHIFGIVTFDSSTGAVISSIFDQFNNSYIPLPTLNDTANNQKSVAFYLCNINSLNLAVSVQVNLTVAATSWNISMVEFTGGLADLDTFSSQVQTNPGSGANAVTTPSATPKKDGSLIIGGVMLSGSAVANQVAPGTGYTENNESTTTVDTEIESKFQISAASVAATWTQAPQTTNTTSFMAIFKFFDPTSNQVRQSGLYHRDRFKAIANMNGII